MTLQYLPLFSENASRQQNYPLLINQSISLLFCAHPDINNATPAHMEAVESLREIKINDIIAGKMAVIAEMNGNDDGERY